MSVRDHRPAPVARVARVAVLHCVVAVIAVATTAAPATAQPKNLSAGASLHVDLRYATTRDLPDNQVNHIVTAGASFRGLVRRGWLAYALGFDYHFGTDVAPNADGNFAYEVHVYPLGVGTNLGKFGFLGAVVGAGFGGVRGRVPFAGQFPVEVFLELDLGSWVRFAGWGRSTWLAGADARQAGSDAAPLGDEMQVGATLRLGKRLREWKLSEGGGYYIGATYAQQIEAEFLGVVFGYSINMLYKN